MRTELTYEQYKKQVYDPAVSCLPQEVGAEITEEIVYNPAGDNWVKVFKSTLGDKVFSVSAVLHTSEIPTCKNK